MTSSQVRALQGLTSSLQRTFTMYALTFTCEMLASRTAYVAVYRTDGSLMSLHYVGPRGALSEFNMQTHKIVARRRRNHAQRPA